MMHNPLSGLLIHINYLVLFLSVRFSFHWFMLKLKSLGENCVLAANQSLDCRATTLFTICLNSAKV